ncbi:membrane protein [Alkalihalobacillus alcalophilus ATCC 27647 = CGMCC 1.3604]|uniref:Membrane protein n=1 Tax=Alkalihalobacillus alcalophilus ATCC 27647 = CGMCC 1.3604 TaxID=1218173 RepID=A0A094WFJ1_ALKAL|nr:AbrB family transcriptional regulator [Alkalihalobacillus alcalophilus]KGA96544.1 membrane protein [Alkalihalobacillus alcalophilus ATCC 27647 = CGMCC 1.3604]MED1564149.1 AbrB family transcriptional regulator [Alkalihalobacillus alcalophilus]THG91840.1 membrane protein [Alkalihalobacillus alcalophilus ATCC 27647 = CGMCC 1.3604]
MQNINKRLFEALLIGTVGGFVFNYFHLPLPWMLGSLTFVMLWQAFTNRILDFPAFCKDAGLVVLGAYFGLYFTAATFMTVAPYFIHYVIATILLIGFSIFLSTLVSKWIAIDEITSVFSSIPGGLTEMAIASESLNAKSSYVVIFQTVRLLTVLFTIPPFIILLFGRNGATISSPITSPVNFIFDWNYLWFILPFVIGYFVRNIIPAGIVIGSMVVTVILNVSPITLPILPEFILIIAQIMIGISLGKSILLSDLKAGGKYCLIYFSIAVLLIMMAFLLGVLFSAVTDIDLVTALLSLAPGGLIEMVLTASQVGADPALVSAFQLTRILIIVIFVPIVLKWYFKRKEQVVGC